MEENVENVDAHNTIVIFGKDANAFQKTADVIATGVGKALGGNPQPNQKVAYKMCSCGHHKNYHD